MRSFQNLLSISFMLNRNGQRMALTTREKFGRNITSIYTDNGALIKLFKAEKCVGFDLWTEVTPSEAADYVCGTGYSVWVEEGELFWF